MLSLHYIVLVQLNVFPLHTKGRKKSNNDSPRVVYIIHFSAFIEKNFEVIENSEGILIDLND